ncbi:MAG: trypsin-like peptidase domain-containing protein [candidate division KSB1 bacterium]|nr:trypsin-like peptidase domain-containing protein [candidate division KSB1 bacterium]MDZ7339912.1 trypsin-like peptidase domain-containing protein [candidate division KSB1 bacterium]
MRKFLSYFFVFVVGTSVGILIWSYWLDRVREPIFYSTSLPSAGPVKGANPSVAMRQVNSQQLANSRQTVITEAVKAVSPAVVGINVLQIKESRSPEWVYDDDFFRFFFPEQRQQVKGLGSGFIISTDGYIVTNEHVVNRATEIMVTLPNGKKYNAQLVASDYISDIALLKINTKESLPYAILGDSDDLIIGEWAIAIGNPFGLFDMGQPSVSQGIISATDRDFGRQNDSRVYKDMIQTDAAINAGNSGGPLVNSLGEVIGINAFIYSGSENNATNIGLGFAIPINRAKKIISELRQYGGVNRRFWTGLEVENLNYSLARYLGLNSTKGVIISNIESRSPAARAQLQVGDVIVSIDDHEIQNTRDIWRVIEDTDAKGGDVLMLKVIRRGRYLNIPLQLEELK